MTASNPPPGWYDDPGDPGGVRYWDGRSWTPYVQPRVGQPPTARATPRRPWVLAVIAVVAAVAMVATLIGWQVLGAARPVGPNPPLPTVTPPAPSSPPRPTSPPTVRAPDPSLTIDPGCVPEQPGRLRTRATTVTLPSGWGPHESPFSFDCAVTASTNTRAGLGDMSVASVDPEWNLSDDGVVAWAWDDLGIVAPFREERVRATVSGRPALVVSRRFTETPTGTPVDSEVRIALIGLGADRRDVVVSLVSIEQGHAEPRLLADVEAMWAGIRVTP